MKLALHTSGPSRSYTQEAMDLGHARELVETLDADEEWTLFDVSRSGTGDGTRLASGRGPHWHDPGTERTPDAAG